MDKSANRLRLLVVDDRRDALLILKTLLAHAGHDVRTADSGSDGLEAAREFSPNAIISDITLAGTMNGYGLAEAVREDVSIPWPCLIAITGHDDGEHRHLAEVAGFDHYLVKPAAIDKLLSILAQVDPRRGRAGDEMASAHSSLA